MTADLIVSSRWILPIAPNNVVLENHSLIVQNGKIVDLLNTSEALKKYSPQQHIQLENHVLMPGLINSHAHTPMSLFRGMADDLNLMDWLNNHIWPAEKALINPESVAVGSRLAIAEMLQSGTTCFNDNYFFPNVTAQVAIEEGIRAALGCVVMSVPTEWAQDEAGYFNKAVATLDNQPNSDLISWTLCPHAPYTVSDSSLTRVKELSANYNIPIHMHVHETGFEIEQGIKDHGKRPLQRIQELGLLSDKFISVHMTQLNDEEIQLIKQAGAHVVHCPKSNLKLASGFAPISKLLAQGINVALGTDGAASNNTLDMIAEMNLSALVAKANSLDPTSVPAPQALEMATINGAKALGIADKTGSLEVGKFADMIAINLDHIATQPVYNPISHLVYAANRSQVTDVWVAGKQLLKSGNFTQLDMSKLLSEAQVWATKAKPFVFESEALKQTQTA